MPSKVCVVARYNEDTSWVMNLPPGWESLIIQKGQHLPNEGREPSSFFYAMQRLKPTGTVAFVQGDPFDHYPNLFDRLAKPIKHFTWLGDTNHSTDSYGAPHHMGLPLGEKHQEWLGRPFQGTTWFGAGGQFAMPGSYLKKYPKKFYKQMQSEACVGENAWVYERIWEALWL